MGTINKVFLYNGVPQNGAIAQLWKITAFAAYADSTATVQDNPLNATDVECLTSNGAVFAVGDVIRMGTEYCLIWAKSGNTIYIIRGWHQSTPAQHNQNVVIYDETVTPPVVDDAVPGAGQQGGNITTGVAYGGDGAYRFDAVPEMEYYASVTYDAHITYVHCFVERNDITPEQILLVDGDILIRNADTITRLPKGTEGYFLKQGANRPAWGAAPPSATYVKLTVPMLQILAATGTFVTDPEKVFDGLLVSCKADAINQYAEILLPAPVRITQWRQNGENVNNEDGVWKIRYLNTSDVWTDWITGISTKKDGWSNWVSDSEVVAQGLRLVCTTVDSSTNSWIKELEVKF